jgi:tRNA A-37 threonylcarbamoyl transferase component Bud32
MICATCHAENDDSADRCGQCGHELFALPDGRVLSDRYEIRGRLGKGGMGVVYRAHDRELDEDVALKTLRPDATGSRAVGKRFRSEIKLARTISHPNVCRIHDYGRDGELAYIVMELVKGVDFKQVVQERGPLPAERGFEVAIQIAEALQAIHDGGIVHRDLKTQNIMQDERGLVKLMDFGIAKRVAATSRQGTTDLTHSGQIVGTPEYMSPEQVHAEALDARSDIYALGIVIFELFTGAVPFRAESFMATAFKQVHDDVPLDGPRADRIPPPLAPILRRALTKAREGRFASAREMAEALRLAQDAMRRLTRADTVAAVAPPVPRPAAAPRSPTIPLEPPARDAPRAFGRVGLAIAVVVMLALVAHRTARRGAAPTIFPRATTNTPHGGGTPTVIPPREAEAPRTTAAPAAVSTQIRPAARSVPAAAAMLAADSLAPAAPAYTPLRGVSRTDSEQVQAPAPADATPDPPALEPTVAPPPSGRVQLAVKPWAEVILDGHSIGTTPLAALPLAPGVHTFRFTHPDYRPILRRVTLRPGEELRLKVDFDVLGVPLR